MSLLEKQFHNIAWLIHAAVSSIINTGDYHGAPGEFIPSNTNQLAIYARIGAAKLSHE